ncbi:MULTISPECIES: exo-alpha-sialidase [Myxococcus]|uniref:exo-alpha-sialidase n=1 Tax=Myxococcus TaxID=32 RepID=UPI001141C0EE|nr:MULTISPECIES: exo-alpha-sialidase [Myxococcus]NOK03649.1 exo-alpha-sialidase [Myxococcus xanthus]
MASLTSAVGRGAWVWLFGGLLLSSGAVAHEGPRRFEEKFGPVLNLSDTPTFNFEYEIAVSGNDVYVVWSDTPAGGITSVFLRRSSDRGKSFSPTQLLSSGITPAFFPSVFAEGKKVYVAWSEQGIQLRASHDHGRTFEPALTLSTSGFTPRLAAENSDVYVTWGVSTGEESVDQLFRASHDRGQSFGPTLTIDNGQEIGVTEIVASNNGVFLVGDDAGVDDIPDVRFRRSTNEGRTFAPLINLSATQGPLQPSQRARIAVKDQKVHVVWEECNDFFPTRCDIVYRCSRNRGATFEPAVVLSDGAGLALDPDLEISGQHVFVAWQDNGPGNFDIFLRISDDRGDSFAKARNLSKSSGDSGAVSLSAEDEFLRVAWEDSTPGPTDIFYRASGDFGDSFEPIKNLSDSPVRSSTPRVLSSKGGKNGYVGWLEDLSDDNTDVFFRRTEVK